MDAGHESIISSFRNAQARLRENEAFSADGKYEMNQMIEGCIKALKQEGRVGSFAPTGKTSPTILTGS